MKTIWKEVDGYTNFEISNTKKVKRNGVLLKSNRGKVRLVKNYKSYIVTIKSLMKKAEF